MDKEYFTTSDIESDTEAVQEYVRIMKGITLIKPVFSLNLQMTHRREKVLQSGGATSSLPLYV